MLAVIVYQATPRDPVVLAGVVLAMGLLGLLTIAASFYGFVRWRDAGASFNMWLWITGAALAYSLLLRPERFVLLPSPRRD